jgi:AcrR family transcriptional regulator
MKTREKILALALLQFNQNGVMNVTARQLAGELNISLGVLSYHFPKKEDLIQALSQQFGAELDSQVHLKMADVASIQDLLHLTYQTFEIILKYKFFMLDLVNIMRNYPVLAQAHRQFIALRIVEQKKLTKKLIEKGLIKNPISAEQENLFIEVIFLMYNFWISQAEILYEGLEENKINYYVKMYWSLILPTLTEKGLAEYQNYEAVSSPQSSHSREVMNKK